VPGVTPAWRGASKSARSGGSRSFMRTDRDFPSGRGERRAVSWKCWKFFRETEWRVMRLGRLMELVIGCVVPQTMSEPVSRKWTRGRWIMEGKESNPHEDTRWQLLLATSAGRGAVG
jgi:hypothetical protein